MKILHVLDHSIPLQSGYASRTRAILNGQRARGWETVQLTSTNQGLDRTVEPCPGPGDGLEETVESLRFHRTTPVLGPAMQLLPGARYAEILASLTRRLMALTIEERPDLLHAHSPALLGLAALRVGRRLGIPVVYECRAFWEDAAVDHGTAREGGLRYRLTRALETYVFRRAAAVVTICQGLAGEIAARDVAQQKIFVVPNAVDLPMPPASEAGMRELAQAHGLSGKRVVAFIGSFYAYEGLDLLLESVPGVVAEVPGLHVVLVGGGPESGRLTELRDALGIGERVTFLGRIPFSEVGNAYGLAELCVYPRRAMRLTEIVTPLKPLEAMAYRRPVVVSDIGGHRELVEHDVNGGLCKPDDPAALRDAIVGALADPGRTAGWVEAGERLVLNERTWTRSVAVYDGAYERALGTTASARAA